MPTLGEFIERVERFGIRVKHSPALAEGPRGPIRFYYLQRGDGTPFVVLPDLRQERRLARETVETWCKTLVLPGEDFGLGPAH